MKVNLSLNQTLLLFFLYVRQIDSSNYSVRGYLSLIRKDSVTHMQGLAVYVNEGLPFTRDLSLQRFADSYLCFRLALLNSVPFFLFPLSITFLVLLFLLHLETLTPIIRIG